MMLSQKNAAGQRIEPEGEKGTVRERRFSSVATTAVRLIYCQSAVVSVSVYFYTH